MASREYDSTGSHLPKIPRKLKTLFKEALANLPATVYKHFGPAAQATVITEADVKELYPAFQGDFEFSSGSNTFLDICKAASHRLKLVNERFRGQFQVLNEEELRKTDEQFRKRKILISTFGRHNSGKSTLLNAILEFRLLPTQWKSETSLVVYIKHDSRRTHRDKCDSPVLRLEKPEPDRFSRSMTVSHKDKLGEHVNSRGHCDSFVLVEEPEPQCFLQSTRIPHKDNLGEHVNSSGQVEERGHESKTAGTPRSFPRSGLQSPPPVRIPPVLSSLRHGRVCQACPMLRITNQESNVEEVTGTSAVRKKLKSLNTTIRSSVTQSHSARKPATGKSIRHRRDVKERPVHKQPLLASTGSGDSTDKVTTRGDIKCAALVNVPLLSSAPAGWDVFLVDTPGYGEHHQEIAAAAEAILKESSAFVYVMDYNVIGGEADANYLRQLYEHDKEVFNNDRLVIAVTKFDQKFQAEDSDDEGDQSDQSRETIKAIVSEQVAELFHVKPKDIVIPISAKNAYRARQLKHSLGDSEQKKKVIEAIAQYPTQPCGQGENRDKHLQTFTSEELVQKLEELSGILELEKRVRMMTRRSVKIWITKMKTDYASYLKTAAKKLEEVLTDTKGRLDGKQKLHGEANREYGEVATIRESLKKSTEEGSAVYETLLQAYDNDMEVVNPTQTVKERVLQMIAGFKEKCLKRMEAEEDAYGANELQQDMKDFSHETTEELEAVFDSDCKFPKVNKALLDAVEDMSDKYRQMRCQADALCQLLPLPSEKPSTPSPPPCEGDTCALLTDRTALSHVSTFESRDSTTEDNTSEEQSDDSGDDEENALPGVPHDLGDIRRRWGGIPMLKLSWRRFLQYLKSLVSWKAKGSEETQRGIDKQALEKELVNLEREILDDCDSHFQEIKIPIVKRFYDEHRDRTMDKLKSFDADFKDCIELRRQRIVKLKEEVDQLKTEVEELSALCFHLPLLCNFLEEVADTTFEHFS